jgi:hypothetical protein
VLRFYWPTVRRTFGILWTATDRYVTGAGIGASLLTFFSPELAKLPWGNLPVLSRWWAVLPLLVLFAYGFLKALYERFEGMEERLETAKNRRAIKDLLGDAIDRGRNLQRTIRKEGDEIVIVTQQDVEDWVHDTHDLIEAAFDKGEARHFLNSEGYDPGHNLPWREARHDPYKYYLEPRLKRLDELIVRANSLEINPDFDPQSATQSAEDSTAERLRLETALEQRNEQNEKLMAHNERLATQRDTFREESERLGAERDGQLRERCWELSKELFKFHDEADQHELFGVMREYERRFKGRVDRVRVHLKRVGWWNPKESTKEQLENPKNLADILSLADYLNASGAHRFW